MSRWYEMSVTVAGFDRRKKRRIIAECTEEWGFGKEDFTEDGRSPGTPVPVLRATAQDHLCGGETEEEFADRFSRTIWKVNGRYCEVTIQATCLENLPSETHLRDEDDYRRWRREKTSRPVEKSRMKKTRSRKRKHSE